MSTENNSLYKILLVDDEQDILDFLSYNLKKEGFQVYTALNGRDAINIAKKEIPHLIVLDVMMPEMDGIDTCREIRDIAGLKDVMIAFLSARNEDYSQIAGFEVGADDYIPKPPETSELKARIEAKLRWSRSISSKQRILTFQDLAIDLEKMSVEIILENGSRYLIDLTPYEFKILKLLVSRPDQVFTRDHIIERVWGGKHLTTRTVDTHVSHLRAKIALSKVQVETVLGSGYKISKKAHLCVDFIEDNSHATCFLSSRAMCCC